MQSDCVGHRIDHVGQRLPGEFGEIRFQNENIDPRGKGEPSGAVQSAESEISLPWNPWFTFPFFRGKTRPVCGQFSSLACLACRLLHFFWKLIFSLFVSVQATCSKQPCLSCAGNPLLSSNSTAAAAAPTAAETEHRIYLRSHRQRRNQKERRRKFRHPFKSKMLSSGNPKFIWGKKQ